MPMNIKLLEIRDSGTFIPCFAFRPGEAHPNSNIVESYLVISSGYPFDNPCVIFGSLNDPERCQNDPYDWPQTPRTMPNAHLWIEQHWDEIKSGDVIDVQFIMAETMVKKTSQAFFERS